MQLLYETFIELGPLGELDAKVWYDYQEAETTSYDEPGCPHGLDCISMTVKLNGEAVDIWSQLTEARQNLIIEIILEEKHSC